VRFPFDPSGKVVVAASLLLLTILAWRVDPTGAQTSVSANVTVVHATAANKIQAVLCPAGFVALGGGGTNGNGSAGLHYGISGPIAAASLTTALASGQAGITTLRVTALPFAIASGDSLLIGSGGAAQTVTASAAAAAGATTIAVTSFTASAAYAVGTYVWDQTVARTAWQPPTSGNGAYPTAPVGWYYNNSFDVEAVSVYAVCSK
jgi:hypothetical protein